MAAIETTIKCPKCGCEIPLTEVIEHQIEDQLARERAEQEAHYSAELAARESQLRQELATSQEEFQTELTRQAAEKIASETQDLREKCDQQAGELKAARAQELKLREAKRELEELREKLELEVARAVDAERARVAAEVSERLTEEHRLSLREKDLELEQMQKQIKELQASAEQKRAGLQGEVLERDIEDVLRERFPRDKIEPIKAGVRGADVLQTVCSPRGHDCGKILWESKRTRNWSNGWVSKLKEDQAAAGADIAIIVCSALPANVRYMDWLDGIWVADTRCVAAIATAVREGLLAVAHAHSVEENRNEALDALYQYLAGKTFRQHIVAAVETFVEMEEDLHRERRAAERQWAKRTKQLERLEVNSSGMYGELQGIMGAALSPVELLELPVAD
jgi:hypothetical protein